MMKCSHIQQHLFNLSEGKVEKGLQEEIHLHLSQCAECSSSYKMIVDVQGIISEQKNIEPSAWFESKVIQKIETGSVTNKSAAFLKPQWIYASSISFAIFIAFLTGYFIGKNNYEYINSSEQSVQKQALNTPADTLQEEQFENTFSLY